MNRLEQTEQLLIQCENDLSRLQEIHQEIEAIEKRRKQLNDYYAEQYIQDYDEQSQLESHYRILDQDSIWNVLTEQYDEKIQLLKALTNTL